MAAVKLNVAQVLYGVFPLGVPVDAVSKPRAIVYRHFVLPHYTNALCKLSQRLDRLTLTPALGGDVITLQLPNSALPACPYGVCWRVVPKITAALRPVPPTLLATADKVLE